MHVQSRGVDLAAPQLQQRRNEGMGGRHVERSALGRGRHPGLHECLRPGQLGNAKIRGVEPVDLGVAQAFQQLGNVAVAGPGGAITAMTIKIHHHPVHIHPLMTRRGEQRRERSRQRRQLGLNRLSDDVIRCHLDHAGSGR